MVLIQTRKAPRQRWHPHITTPRRENTRVFCRSCEAVVEVLHDGQSFCACGMAYRFAGGGETSTTVGKEEPVDR